MVKNDPIECVCDGQSCFHAPIMAENDNNFIFECTCKLSKNIFIHIWLNIFKCVYDGQKLFTFEHLKVAVKSKNFACTCCNGQETSQIKSDVSVPIWPNIIEMNV